MLWIWFSAPAFRGPLIFVCISLHEILLQDFSGLTVDTDTGVLVRKWKTVHLHETVWEHYFCLCKTLDFHRYFLFLVSSIRPTCVPTLAHSAFIPWRCEGSKSPSPMRTLKEKHFSVSSRPMGERYKVTRGPSFSAPEQVWTETVFLLSLVHTKHWKICFKKPVFLCHAKFCMKIRWILWIIWLFVIWTPLGKINRHWACSVGNSQGEIT